jgi:hypothetical protein
MEYWFVPTGVMVSGGAFCDTPLKTPNIKPATTKARANVTASFRKETFPSLISFIRFIGVNIYFDEWFNVLWLHSQAKVLHMMSGKASMIVRVRLLTCQHQKTACTTEHRRPTGAENPTAKGVDAKRLCRQAAIVRLGHQPGIGDEP